MRGKAVEKKRIACTELDVQLKHASYLDEKKSKDESNNTTSLRLTDIVKGLMTFHTLACVQVNFFNNIYAMSNIKQATHQIILLLQKPNMKKDTKTNGPKL